MIQIEFDILTLIVSGVLLFLSVLTPFFSAFFRRPQPDDTDDSMPAKDLPSCSVIFTVHDNAEAIERNLPLFLQQQYEANYEVIVVDESSTDQTEDVLKRLKAAHANLYTTFIPESSRYMSRRKLALTIGIKAAKYDWIVITDINCQPASDHLLNTICHLCDAETDIVCGYTNYDDSASAYQRCERLEQALYQMRKAQHGTAYAYNGRNLAFRKQLFMEHNGFLGNLKYLRGEYDFIVNEYAQEFRTKTMYAPDGVMIEEAPSKKEWKDTRLTYMETRRHLARSATYRILPDIDTTLLHANLWLQLGGICYGIITHNYIILCAAILAFCLSMTIRTVIIRQTSKRMGEQIALFKLPFLGFLVVWQNLLFLCRHRFADKHEFIRR